MVKKQKLKEIKQDKPKIHKRVYHKAKSTSLRVKNEFQKQVITGITAALAFLIALSWREPIKQAVDIIIIKLGVGKQVTLQFLSALFVTLIAVVILMIISRWKVE